jgi:hypothetical protein
VTVDTVEQRAAEETGDPVLSFMDAWRRPRSPFAEWVREVARTFYDAHLTLERAARLVRSTPAEVEAALKLATLEEDLDLLDGDAPPKTTWFLLAEATRDGLEAALKALDEWAQLRPPKDAPSRVVVEARHLAEGPSADERVATVDGKVLGHLAAKARQYDLLKPRERKFLVDASKRRRSGQPLSPKQTAWAKSLFIQLIEGGAVRGDSPDGDQELCDVVLDIMGVGSTR